MTTLEKIGKEAFEIYSSRAILAGLDPVELMITIQDIVLYASNKTTAMINSAGQKKKIHILDTEKKSEMELEQWFSETLLTHDVISIDQIGKHRFAVTTFENVPNLE